MISLLFLRAGTHVASPLTAPLTSEHTHYEATLHGRMQTTLALILQPTRTKVPNNETGSKGGCVLLLPTLFLFKLLYAQVQR